jgi:hypothetical protein
VAFIPFGKKILECILVGLQWFSNCILLVSLVFFFLVYISFSFFAFFTTMALRPRLAVSINNINEGSRDVPFKDKIPSWYGNWNLNKELKLHTCIAI